MVAATAAAAVPAGMIPALTTATEEAPLTDEELAEVGSSGDGVLVAHVKDLASGRISVFSGTREVVIRDAGMAARLARAMK